MKSAFILGTRPEIIKLSPVIREHIKRDIPFIIIHTNQHYSPEMDKVFFQQLNLPSADFNLSVGHSFSGEPRIRMSEGQEPVYIPVDEDGNWGGLVGRILESLDPVLRELKPELVFVQGDTHSVLAGALMANRLRIPVAHVEAGLRSYDRRMPEETNRKLTDHLSDFLFAPTDKARQILIGEGLAQEKIHVTGNTVVDAIQAVSELVNKLAPLSQSWKLESGRFILVTLHRPENVDSSSTLSPILEAIATLADKCAMPAVFPVHPRTSKRLEQFNITLSDSFIRLEATDYLRFVQLEKEACLVVTDSGGVQEEACILGVPCITVRLSTERPETVEAGANLVTGVEPESIIAGALKMMERSRSWSNPFGDGKAGEKIVEIVMEKQTGGRRLP